MSEYGTAGSIEPAAWDRFVAGHPAAHLLQTSAWAELKSRFGWAAERVGLLADHTVVAGAHVLYRRLPAGLGQLAYVPRGPLVDWDDDLQVSALLEAIERTARARGAIALTVEPELPDEAVHRSRLLALDFSPAPVTIQPPRTIVVDLTGDEDAILAAMKSKTRYNIRLAGRRGVTVREAGERDLPAFHALMATTGDRDDFGIHTPAYYEAAYRLFAPRDWARLLLAEVGGEPVAALMVFALAARSWYLYGASADAHREKMPTYLLQWEAMRWAKSRGCTTYDLWGIPDVPEQHLEAEFTTRQDGLWGVYRFKRGFGGQVVRSVGAWDRVLAPWRYRVVRWLLALRGQTRSMLQ
jgi:lipid II:glycine glycyltransferase (peptidoglycan interpeptide bridge formation enzyme)